MQRFAWRRKARREGPRKKAGLSMSDRLPHHKEQKSVNFDRSIRKCHSRRFFSCGRSAESGKTWTPFSASLRRMASVSNFELDIYQLFYGFSSVFIGDFRE